MDIQEFNNYCDQQEYAKALKLLTQYEQNLLIAIANFQPIPFGKLAIILNPKASFCSSRVNQETFKKEDMQRVQVTMGGLIRAEIITCADSSGFELEFAENYQSLGAHCKGLYLDPNGFVSKTSFMEFVVNSMVENIEFHARLLEVYGILVCKPKEYAEGEIDGLLQNYDLFSDADFPISE